MPFEKGKSGNPKGRPKTTAPTTAKELREAISARSLDLVNKLIDVALVQGDVTALKYLIDKVLPSLPVETITATTSATALRTMDDFYRDYGDSEH